MGSIESQQQAVEFLKVLGIGLAEETVSRALEIPEPDSEDYED